MSNQDEMKKLNGFMRMQQWWAAIFALTMAAGCVFGIVMICIALWKMHHV